MDPRGNMIYQARAGQVAYGYAIGMLCAEWHIPFIPGDLNNAGTFPFPVRYESVKGVSGAEVLRGNGADYAQIMADDAKKLEAEGVRAITGNCGFMAGFQEFVASQVNIPVFLTSLVQIPMLLNMLGSQHHIGILTANSASLTDGLLANAGITDSSRLTIQGMETYNHFNDVILKELGTLDEDKMRMESVQAAKDAIKRDPAIRAFMLECSDLPPYSKAIEDATGLPVFDWANFISYVYNATVPRSYSGIV